MELKRLEHSCFKIVGGNGEIVYIDPYGLKQTDKADVVLVTHGHHDHCSLEDIKKISTDDTIVIASEGCSIRGNIRHMKPGDKIEAKGIEVAAVPAYNIGKPFHPKERGDLGYIIKIDGKRIYHAGDTDLIPEIRSIKCDIAILPVSGIYVMNPEEAAKAADLINPSLVAMPMHYGSGIVGTKEDAETFERATSVPVAFETYTC